MQIPTVHLKGGLATKLGDVERELHQRPDAAQHDRLSHNMSDIYSTNKRTQTASNPINK